MHSSLFRPNLFAADAICEEIAREEINRFYKSIVYDGRFRHPDFSEVGQAWIRLIKAKEIKFSAVTVEFLGVAARIDEELLSEIEAVVEEMLQDGRYLERLHQFLGTVTRRAASYGISFSVEASGFALANASYTAGVQNSLRAARSGIASALQTYIFQRGIPTMFSRLMTDTVSIVKKDNKRFDGIKASVQSDKIFVSGSDVLIESGDLIQRKMSNGGEETFEVIDPGFHEKFHTIPAGYQIAVKKLGIPEAQKALNVTNISMNGHGARAYVQSTDNSSNVVNVNADALEYVNALRNTIQGATLLPAEKQAASEVIDAVEGHIKSEHPSKTVISALLAALPHVANVATITTSLLSLF